jgi:F0F1-type ATP synthase epsilon subunit
MADRLLKVSVRTPHETVFEADCRSLRIPTESGQVGLRPAVERHVTAFETGIVNFQTPDHRIRFIGTAGGLLLCDGMTATLLTPLAVVGDDEESVVSRLDDILSQPGSEMETRMMLSRLEGEIVNELQRDRSERMRAREL